MQTARSVSINWRSYSTLLALIVLFLVLAILTQGDFIDARNFTNLTRQISLNSILAIGMTFIILTSGIDLSVGAVVALSGIVVGISQVYWGFDQLGYTGAALSLLLGILCGVAVGLFNGLLVGFFSIPAFVVTLGTMVMARGLALIVSESSAISPMGNELKLLSRGMISPQFTFIIFLLALILWGKIFVQRLKSPLTIIQKLLFIPEIICLFFPAYCFMTDRGLPVPVLILMILFAFGFLILKNLPLGRYIYAVGGNEEAAYLSGVPTKKVKLFVYIFMGALAGLCGVLLASRLNSATPTEGELMELDAIAAVVIGGTSLKGGQGHLLGCLLGAFFIGTLNNGMDLLEVNTNYQMLFKGIIIICAVWYDSYSKRKNI